MTATTFTNTQYSEGLYKSKNRQDFIVGIMNAIAEVSKSDLSEPYRLLRIENFERILNNYCLNEGFAQ